MLSDLPRPRACRRDAAINLLATRSTRSPRSIRNRSNEPETCRQSSSAHTRSAPRLRAHPSNAAAPFAPDWTVCSPSSSPVVAETAAIVCERLWVSAPSTIIDLVHLHIDRVGRPADTACWGRCHAPIKSRQTSPTGDERHSERWSGPTADSLNESQLAAGRGAFTSRRTSPTSQIQTASLKGSVSATNASGGFGWQCRFGAREGHARTARAERRAGYASLGRVQWLGAATAGGGEAGPWPGACGPSRP